MNMFIKVMKDCAAAGAVAAPCVLGPAAILWLLLGPASLYITLFFGPMVFGISFLGALFVLERRERRNR